MLRRPQETGTLHDDCYKKTSQHKSCRPARKLQCAIQRQPPPDGVWGPFEL